MATRQEVIEAIRASWTRETSSVPDEWSPQNPARGQCDASSFVFWERLGGNLVLASVYVDGVQTEHHYWNRIDGEDIDLTREQFVDGQDIQELEVVPDEYIRGHAPTIRHELRARIDSMRESVLGNLAS